MLISGICLTAYGIIGLISLLFLVQMTSINISDVINEELLLKIFATDVIALTVGAVLIIYAVVKCKNAFDRLMNSEDNTTEQVNKNSVLSTVICPKCGACIYKKPVGK